MQKRIIRAIFSLKDCDLIYVNYGKFDLGGFLVIESGQRLEGYMLIMLLLRRGQYGWCFQSGWCSMQVFEGESWQRPWWVLDFQVGYWIIYNIYTPSSTILKVNNFEVGGVQIISLLLFCFLLIQESETSTIILFLS